jgi:hypothetical protein
MRRILFTLAFPVLASIIIFAFFPRGQTFGRLVDYKKDYEQGRVPVKEVSDLDHDEEQEVYVLQGGELTVSENGKIIWQSPPEWWVDSFALADATNDGVMDVSLSVWKAGNYGSSKPFWVKQNDQSAKNHFFVFIFRNNSLEPIWQSSNLKSPNCEFEIADRDHDGKNELIVIEGSYEDWPACKGRHSALWKWNGWGFTNEWRE